MRAPLKICGLTNPAEARFCADAGAAALGVVFYPPSPRNVTPERAAKIFAGLPREVARVGVFVNATLEEMLDASRTAGLTVAQLHGTESPALAAALLASGLKVLKTVRGGGSVATEAARYPHGTRFLVECGRGPLPGGNGAAWDWSSARTTAGIPFAIAGGLSPENLEIAANASGAAFFDLSSAVESTPGRKDGEKVVAAVAAARKTAGNPEFLN